MMQDVVLSVDKGPNFAKLGVPFLGVPIKRTIVLGGLCGGAPIVGNPEVLDDQESSSLAARFARCQPNRPRTKPRDPKSPM